MGKLVYGASQEASCGFAPNAQSSRSQCVHASTDTASTAFASVAVQTGFLHRAMCCNCNDVNMMSP